MNSHVPCDLTILIFISSNSIRRVCFSFTCNPGVSSIPVGIALAQLRHDEPSIETTGERRNYK